MDQSRLGKERPMERANGAAAGHPPQLQSEGRAAAAKAPVVIAMHERDNVAIVANDGGLPAGTVLPSGLVLRDHVPQGHKVALEDFAEG